jgi:putative hydrolase of the HAD superfamily
MGDTPHKAIDVIAFDADDTLWHNESLFTVTQGRFKQLLAAYHSDEWIEAKLNETERRNIEHFGYGIKGFTLSMIETAIELTEGRVSGAEICEIIGYAKAMLKAPVDLLDGVYRTIIARHGLDPRRFLMVGNSIKSDVLPVVAAGGRAVYVPYEMTWVHERVTDYDATTFWEIAHIGLLPDLLQEMAGDV